MNDNFLNNVSRFTRLRFSCQFGIVIIRECVGPKSLVRKRASENYSQFIKRDFGWTWVITHTRAHLYSIRYTKNAFKCLLTLLVISFDISHAAGWIPFKCMWVCHARISQLLCDTFVSSTTFIVERFLFRWIQPPPLLTPTTVYWRVEQIAGNMCILEPPTPPPLSSPRIFFSVFILVVIFKSL